MKNIKVITTISMMLAIAIVLNVVEMQLSFIPVPGAKIGFANLVTLIVLYIYGFKWAFTVNVLRVVIVAGFFSPKGFDYTFYMALTGAVTSVSLMALLKQFTKIHVVTVSVLGAVMHTVGQVAILMISLETLPLIFYLPIMLVISIPSGILIGIIGKRFFQVFKEIPHPDTF
ncbi:MAG TPA: Gx transporter family protein [Acholeplasma sp.]|jgi:heptaprenyl diphosphate synthase